MKREEESRWQAGTPAGFRARHIRRRLGLTEPAAAVIAQLAFGEDAR
jgi:hypothetical protein